MRNPTSFARRKIIAVISLNTYRFNVAVQFTILGSGSAGNCACVETADTRILIDAGFSLKQIRERLATIGRSPESLSGVLITHEHSDHVQGLAGLASKLRIPIYCNRPTREAIEWQQRDSGSGSGLRTQPFDCRIFATGASFEIGDITVDTFTVPHDAAEPVGFVLRTSAGSIGFVTDLGHVTKLIVDRLRDVNALVLEANHDVKMLQDCVRRPWSLKQRILGRHGHLSNDGAADAAEQIMSPNLRNLFLGHLSRECNRPDLAQNVVSQRLTQIGATHCSLHMTSQSIPSATLNL